MEIGALFVLAMDRAFMIRAFTLGHVRTFSIAMSSDITCIKNGTIIMAQHEFEYLPRFGLFLFYIISQLQALL